MTKQELIDFENEVAEAFKAKKIKGPIHLSGGNEDQLISAFKKIAPSDYVFSFYRSHYHALCHGIPRDWLMKEIIEGRSMNINSPEHRFASSAIVGGMLSIAVGVAAGIKRRNAPEKVWCFCGDMAATTGAFYEATRYSARNRLPVKFIIENNHYSCDTPTVEAWGGVQSNNSNRERYDYQRKWPHAGVGYYVF